MSENIKTISILGTRGIPASYSGFETSVQETALRFVKLGHNVIVYCRANHFKNHPKEYFGVKLIYLFSIKNKFLDTITHSLFSIFHCLFSKTDGIILYGIGNAFLLPVLRIKGIPVVSVVDGADWKRGKWNKFAKWFLRINRKFAVRWSSHYVVDNEQLANEYMQLFGKMPSYIPYGANIPESYDQSVLQKWDLTERKYIIFIGRFVKEKGVDLLIRSFEKVNGDVNLVIIGDNEFDREYVQQLYTTKDQRIVFTGYLYGKEYESLLHYALFYVSASLLEGTSPSLLSAMAVNGFAVVSDLPENIEVLKGSCALFKTGDQNSITENISKYITSPEIIEIEREKTKNIVKEYYNWDEISLKYLKLLNINHTLKKP